MEADGGPTPSQVVHKAQEDRTLVLSTTTSQEQASEGCDFLLLLLSHLFLLMRKSPVGGGSPADLSDSGETENSWSLCVVMGQRSGTGSLAEDL